MKSGCLGTIFWNGIAQCILHALACLRMGMDFREIIRQMPHVMGDDTLQNAIANLEQYLKELNLAGCIARDCSEALLPEKLDFAGHFFNLEECLPAYGVKHFGMLAEESDFKSEQLLSYLRLYAYDPEMYQRLAKWLNAKDQFVLSREYLMDWYSGVFDD